VTDRNRLRESAWWRRIIMAAAGLLLLGAGLAIGATWLGKAGPASSAAARRPATGNIPVIEMNQATAVACRPPVAPGPGHPDPLLSQEFNVADDSHSAYLLGWQILPYRGAGTYKLATAGNLLALEPATGGRPLGYGNGTVTISGNPASGSVHASVALKSGRTLGVEGSWTCVSDSG
jgi:hypothetical protein